MGKLLHGAAIVLPFAAFLLVLGAATAAEPSRPQPRDESAQAAKYARCMRLARDQPRAARDFAEAWLKKGGAHPAEHCAAVALIGLKHYKEGAKRLEALAAAMTHAPASLRAGVLDQAGQAWLLADEPVRAYADAGEAVSLEPGDPELLIDKAVAAAAAGYYGKAVEALDQVLNKHPKRVDALIYRASAYRKLGRLDAAFADSEAALAEAPRSAAAWLERGNILRLKGDAAGAGRAWRLVMALAPHSPAARDATYNLAHLDQKLPHTNKPAAP